jgi:hypothetical protein
VGAPPTAELYFVFLGVGVGAVIPSLVVGGLAVFERSFLVGPHRWMSAPSWFLVGMGFCLAGFILALLGILTGSGPDLTDRLLLLAGALCVLSLEAFVISTGGPILSVFSFYYLYIPVVVGITFPRALTFWTGVVCWAGCIAALLFTQDSTTWRSSAQLMGTRLHSIAYGFLFSVQMIVTIAMIYLGQSNLKLSGQ